MTTSVSTRPAGRLNPTRQQLDELDALLQRMLDLPVHPLDEPDEAPAEVEEPDMPLPAAVIHDEPLATEDVSLAPESDEEPTPAVQALQEPQPLEDADPWPVQPVPRPARPLMSYMVVETASPRPLPPASGFEPRQPASRLVPVTPPAETPAAAPLKSEQEEWPREEQLPPYSLLLPPHFAPTADEPPLEDPDAAEMWVPLRSTWKPSPQTWPPLAESWHHANGGALPPAASAPAPSPRMEPIAPAAPVKSEETEAQSEEQPTAPISPEQPRLRLSAEDAPATVPVPFLPLLWFNQGFDACLAPLGAPGRWLGGNGRWVLGFLGLACLASAVVIAVSARMAWTW